MFSSKSFMILVLSFTSLIHFELIFIIPYEIGYPTLFFCMGCLIVSALFVGMVIIFKWVGVYCQSFYVTFLN